MADLHLGGPRGWHRNEGRTIKNQIGGQWGGGHGVNGGPWPTRSPPPHSYATVVGSILHGEPIEFFVVKASAPRLLAKAVVCAILSVGLCK